MTSLSGNQGRYQGYPYKNPIVTEVHSVDPETASKWTNLPRKQITEGSGDQNKNINLIHGSSRPDSLKISKNNDVDEPSTNVYIDLPIINPNETNQRRNEPTNVRTNSSYQGYPYRNPTVTDVRTVDSETASKWSNLSRKPVSNGQDNQNRTSENGSSRLDQKPNEEPPMNIYIDLPIINSDEVAGRRDEARGGENNTGFVEDTIFYDPFENRRINDGRNQDTPRTDMSVSTPGPSTSEGSTPTVGSSSRTGSISQATNPPRLPSHMSKETYVYGSRTPDDTFPLSPIPVSEFPEPPPAYSEVDRRIEPDPPRTVVVVPDRTATVGIASNNRKFLVCPHCGLQVNTLAILENGALTHVLAVIFLFVFAPITVFIYCTNICKYKNHYCPNCNQLIGYEVPILCQDMVYNKPNN